MPSLKRAPGRSGEMCRICGAAGGAAAMTCTAAAATMTTRLKMMGLRFMGPPETLFGFRVPFALGHGRDVILEALERKRKGLAEFGAPVGGHEQLGHGDAVVEVFLRPDAADEGLDHVPVLGDIAVFSGLVGDDGHQPDLVVLLLDPVLAGLALDRAAEKDLEAGVERVDLQGVLGAEELHAQAQAGPDVAPARRRLDDEDLAGLVPVLDERPGAVLGPPLQVVRLAAAVAGQDRGVFGLLPLEAVG